MYALKKNKWKIIFFWLKTGRFHLALLGNDFKLFFKRSTKWTIKKLTSHTPYFAL